jgi:NAD(P)-dependent dehydrogenase (short-subunit alcohol dehydrogenase family)
MESINRALSIDYKTVALWRDNIGKFIRHPFGGGRFRDYIWPKSPTIDPKGDIVAITGGSSGLGYQLASVLAKQHKFTVAILDVHAPSGDQIPGVHYYHCDVGSNESVDRAAREIRKDLGVVTILINNAGIFKGGKPAFELTYEEVRDTFDINLMSSFSTIKAFVPGMIERHRGYVVTIGSVLGHVSPAKLSAYSASKAGLLALHEALSYELGPPLSPKSGIRMLLVTPGQINTGLFSGVKTPSKWLAPVLEPSYIATAVVDALKRGEVGELKLPFYVRFMPLMRVVPLRIAQLAREYSGMDKAMISM